jgi:hypothetical protein
MGFGFTQSRKVAKPQKKDFAYRCIGTASLREKIKRKIRNLIASSIGKPIRTFMANFSKPKTKKLHISLTLIETN